MTSPETCTPDLLRGCSCSSTCPTTSSSTCASTARWMHVEPGWLYRQGEDATCFYVLLDGAVVMSRRVGDDEVEVNRTSTAASYVGAWNAYLGDLVPQVYDQSVRVTEPARFFELDADGAARRHAGVVPDGASTCSGAVPGLHEPAADASASASGCWPSVAVGRADPRAEQPGRRRGAGHRDAAAAGVRDAGEAGAARRRPPGRGGAADPDQVPGRGRQRVAEAPTLPRWRPSDREDELSDWLDDHGVGHGCEIAPTFVQAGVDGDWLDLVANAAPRGLAGRARSTGCTTRSTPSC